jgi:DNA-binding NarL/FixJ family response regulator
MKKNISTEEKQLDLLEKILRVLSVQVGIDKSLTERVALLRLAGIDNKMIAKVLNTTEATVRALFSKSRQK